MFRVYSDLARPIVSTFIRYIQNSVTTNSNICHATSLTQTLNNTKHITFHIKTVRITDSVETVSKMKQSIYNREF